MLNGRVGQDAVAEDRSLYKRGKFLPGTHIPIYAPQKIE